ncbi:MAG: large subunit ribosomal protein L3 [Bradymonadia bacterium]|jgi:large subunit ribosomal protein L3
MGKMILGRKIGMTQIFDETGRRIPVTAVQVGPMTVVGKKSEEGKDGYASVQIGFEDADRQEKDGNVRWRGLTKAQLGVFARAGIEVPKKILREMRVSEGELDGYEVGQVLDHSLFLEGAIIDATGTSKGSGFTGVMKRHNFRGGKASHGVHESYRGGGSIGASAYPARVFRGKKMAGRHGGAQVTVQNLRLVRIIAEDNLYLIRGAVPGHNGALVKIQHAVKKHR